MDKSVKILMVEDDVNLGYLLKENFEPKGFFIHLCRDGEEAMYTFLNGSFDLLILDIMLPKMDGFALAAQIRKRDKEIPIIFLSAKSLEEDKLQAFDLGCDDYITKPFSAKELLLRIKAILRRSQSQHDLPVSDLPNQLGRFTFDYMNRNLVLDGLPQKLSTKEAELLKLFCEHKNTLLNRAAILTKVWGNDDYFAAKSMDVYLTRLRKLLKGDPGLEIQNVHGTGFRLVVKSQVEVS
jgi:DNA-binding response OmpR family regulator